MRRLRFRERLQLGITALLLTFVAAAAIGLRTLADHHAEKKVGNQIRAGRASFEILMTQLRGQLRGEARMLSRTPLLLAVSAIQGVDAATFGDVFDDIQRSVEVPMLAVCDANGRVLAERGGAFPVGADLSERAAFVSASGGETVDAVWASASGPALVGVAPLDQGGELLGALVLALPLDAAFAARVGTSAGRDVLLAAAGAPLGAYWRDEPPTEVAAAELYRQDHANLPPAGRELEIDCDGQPRRGLAVRLHPDGGIAFLPHDLGALANLQAELRNLLLVTGCLIAVFGLYFATRIGQRLSQPLEQLIAATDRMRSGDLGTRVPPDGLGEEFGRLAQSFNGMADTVQRLVDDVRDKASRAEAANRAKDGFLASVSHELRTPLTGIQSTAQLLEMYGEEASPAERAEFLHTILTESERLGQRITDALEFASLVGGTTAWTVGRVDLERACEDACDRITSLATLKPVAITIDCVPGAILTGDRERITQAIHHLLHNAWKWSPEGGAIDVRVAAAEDHFAVEVDDQGPGIPPAERTRIFESFGQGGDVLVDKPQGIGLGLPIVAEIATAHGGRLAYEDRPEGGARFRLTLELTGRPIDRAAAMR